MTGHRRHGSKVGAALALGALLPWGIQGAEARVGQVAQYGITWTFSADRPAGQFANGDWWVVGPVTVVDIDPKTVPGAYGPDKDSDGSMVNPIPGQSQGLYRC